MLEEKEKEEEGLYNEQRVEIAFSWTTLGVIVLSTYLLGKI